MTNLEVIKHLATNNPTRLAEFLSDIYNDAYLDGYNDDWDARPNFEKWLFKDVSDVSVWFSNQELKEWSKTIKNPPIEITYPDNLVIELPWEGKDPNHMWNTDNGFNIVSKALEELELLETLNQVVTISDVVYDNFRKNVCASCSDQNCLRSQAEICDCYKFEV